MAAVVHVCPNDRHQELITAVTDLNCRHECDCYNFDGCAHL
jgi:hypothetical protein